MKIAAYTSLTGCYLPNGRIVAESVKQHHPEWDFYLLFNDRTPPGIAWEDEPFDEVVFAEWLDIDRPWNEWAFNYSVVEFCTATKGVMAKYLLEEKGYDAVVYLDPDTQLFSRLVEIENILKDGRHDVVLTPHLTDREHDAYSIWSHEMAALKHGTFNLGFYVIANTEKGRKYLNWWAERLVDHSHIDFNTGLFTDQKWANLAPYMFDGIHVLTDRAYNVATWNMTNRHITKTDRGEWLVNDSPLRFYHFSGFGHGFAWANSELSRLAGDQVGLQELWENYKALYDRHALREDAPPWHFGVKESGQAISPADRIQAKELAEINPYE